MVGVRQLDLVVSVLLVLLGCYVAYEGTTYGYVDRGAPSAGFFPFWIGLGIVLFSALNLVKVARRTGLVERIANKEIGRVLVASAVMAGFILLSPLIGMIASIFLLMLAVGAIFGPCERQFYIALIGMSAGMTGLLYVVFARFLAVPLI